MSKFDDLKRLKSLLDRGAITPAEYDVQKKRILAEGSVSGANVPETVDDPLGALEISRSEPSASATNVPETVDELPYNSANNTSDDMRTDSQEDEAIARDTEQPLLKVNSSDEIETEYGVNAYETDRRAIADELRKQARKPIIIGVIFLVLGSVVTIGTYSVAEYGDKYILWWGAIVFGIVDIIRGCVKYGGADKKAVELLNQHLQQQNQYGQ
jgi:hypothetical protein